MKAPFRALGLLALGLLALAAPCIAYRQLHFTNADVCDSGGKKTSTINTGEGALILSLTNKSYTTFGEKKKCNILIKAKSGFGLLVHAEDFRLRTSVSKEGEVSCHDYIEFGREDYVPLWTKERSGKLCGSRTDVNYEEPGGQLLIWLQLGAARPPGPPALSLVITPYSKERHPKGSNYCECAGPWQRRGTATATSEQWVRCQYFCDGRVNCAKDSLPADEADVSCQQKTVVAPPRTGGGLLPGGQGTTPPGFVFLDPPRQVASELSVGSILILALLGLALIACGILCTVKRCGPPVQGPSSVDNPNCPEQAALSMVELVRQPATTQENIYCPGPQATASPVVEAPPPLYTDIFPPDYVPPDLRPQPEA